MTLWWDHFKVVANRPCFICKIPIFMYISHNTYFISIWNVYYIQNVYYIPYYTLYYVLDSIRIAKVFLFILRIFMHRKYHLKTCNKLIARNGYFWITRLDRDVGEERKFMVSCYIFLPHNVNFSQDYTLFLRFIYLLTYLFIEQGEVREKEGERNINVGERHQSFVSNRGPGPQPRHVPLPGIEPTTFWFSGWCPPTESHQSGLYSFYNKK